MGSSNTPKLVQLTIDGREIEVEEGTTILEAARRLEIRIPTLCHVEGFEPSASCFICAVQIDGQDLYIHWINVRSENVEEATQHISQRFEWFLHKIFE